MISGSAVKWVRNLRWPVSSSPLIVDLDGDGEPEVVVAAGRVHAFRLDGSRVPGWPAADRSAFASTPAAADLDGDGRVEVVCGADDDRLYAWNARGRLLPGWPVATAGDIYSSPVLLDLDGDGHPEIVAGSDDGHLHALDRNARPLPGWPAKLGGFVSCTPGTGDADGDGDAEIAVGDWSGRAWLLKCDGTCLPGWPVETGDLIWSSPVISDIDGDGRAEIIVVSNRVDVLGVDGRSKPGWPRWLPGLAVSSPVITPSGTGGRLVVLASDALRIWDGGGNPWPGTPVPLPAYAWSTPAVSMIGDRLEVIIGCLDGGCHRWTPDRGLELVHRFRGPVFSSPALLRDGRGWGMAAASWDQRLACVELPEPLLPRTVVSAQFRSTATHVIPVPPEPAKPGANPPCPPEPPPFRPTQVLGHAHRPPVAYQPTIVRLRIAGGPPRRPRLMFTRGAAPPAPSPLLGHSDRWLAILPPAGPGTTIRWHVEWAEPDGTYLRYPEAAEIESTVSRWRHLLRLTPWGGS